MQKPLATYPNQIVPTFRMVIDAGSTDTQPLGHLFDRDLVKSDRQNRVSKDLPRDLDSPVDRLNSHVRKAIS